MYRSLLPVPTTQLAPGPMHTVQNPEEPMMMNTVQPRMKPRMKEFREMWVATREPLPLTTMAARSPLQE